MGINFNNVNLRISAGRTDQFPAYAMPQVVLSGRSNVGKSSLINTLLGRKNLARVSSVPGKTDTINFYEVDGSFFLVDLPGYGYAKKAKDKQTVWSSLAESFFTANKYIDRIRLVVQLVDIRTGITEDDAHMLSFMNHAAIPYIIVPTKADKPNKTERAEALENIENSLLLRQGCPVIPFSSLNGEGKDRLLSEILRAVK